MTEYRMAPSGEVYEDRYVPPNADWSLVAVIPYEDHGAVARLVAEWQFARGETAVQRAQNALRGYVLPPKPAEPTDPAARAIDRHGYEWARAHMDGLWRCLGVGMSAHSWDRLVDECGPLEVTG